VKLCVKRVYNKDGGGLTNGEKRGWSKKDIRSILRTTSLENSHCKRKQRSRKVAG
jgi:hypothetical protein